MSTITKNKQRAAHDAELVSQGGGRSTTALAPEAKAQLISQGLEVAGDLINTLVTTHRDLRHAELEADREDSRNQYALKEAEQQLKARTEVANKRMEILGRAAEAAIQHGASDDLNTVLHYMAPAEKVTISPRDES